MRIAVTDANIFIDLFEIVWLENLFKIDLEIVTTREVFNELNEPQQESLNKKIELFSEQDLDSHILPHPLLGKLTFREMLYFTIYHVQHHQDLMLKYLED